MHLDYISEENKQKILIVMNITILQIVNDEARA
jgi:hypothetical protein